MHAWILIAGAAATVSAGAPVEELKVGAWTCRYDASRIVGLAYEGRVLWRGSSVTGFEPEWKGSYFHMRDARVTVERDGAAARVVWEKAQPGAIHVRAVLTLAGPTAGWAVTVSATRKGPVEVGLLVPAAGIESAPGVSQCRLGKSPFVIDEQTDFGTVRLGSPMHIRTPKYDLTLTTRAPGGAWMLQDKRRTAIKNLRLIVGLRADGAKPLKATVGVRLSVAAAPESEVTARAKRLSQRRRRVLPAPVVNAGFEAGDKPEGWTCPANGAVVTDQPGQGRRCVQLVVGSEKERGVYITQHVPIQPGSRYQASALVRRRDVRSAPVLGMSGVGAKLIVEWADKDKKWLAPGAYSKQNGFGSGDWQRHHCAGLIAPAKAAYAILFLALRGTGTAWFDDVRLTEVRRMIELVSPGYDVHLKDNRPLLAWTEEPDAQGYEVQLATDPTFKAGAGLVRAATVANAYRPEQALAPGVWCWRVRMKPGRWPQTWRFTQTAAVDADTTGPEMAPVTQSIRSADQPVRVRLSDPAGIDAARLEASAQGLKLGVKLVGDVAEIRAAGGWKRGAYELSMRAADRLGNGSQRDFWIAVAPAPPESLRWDRQRGVFDGSRHVFPIGIYQVKKQDYAKVRKAGFTLVHQYTWEGSQDDAKARAYLDGVHAAGLRAFVGFDRGRSSKNGLVQMNYAHVARRIAALRDHPGLMAWYLFDEPDLAHQYIAPRNLKAWYRFIKALDPHHPVIVTLAVRGSITRYGAGCYDVYWTMAYRDTQYITKLIETHQEELGPERPHLVILHSYDRDQRAKAASGEPVDHAAFQPDLALFRANAYMALAHGSSGLCWWWYGDGGRNFLSVGDVPAAWGWLSSVVAEVKQLEPMLTAEGEILPLSIACEPKDLGVRAWAKKTAKGVTVIAVSPDAKRAGRVTIGCKALPVSGRATVKFEDRTAPIQGGAIVDRFGANEAHVYQIGQ